MLLRRVTNKSRAAFRPLGTEQKLRGTLGILYFKLQSQGYMNMNRKVMSGVRYKEIFTPGSNVLAGAEGMGPQEVVQGSWEKDKKLIDVSRQRFSTKHRAKILNLVNGKQSVERKEDVDNQSLKKAPLFEEVNLHLVSEKWDAVQDESQAYTSRYFRVPPGEIDHFLTSLNLQYRHSNGEIVLKYCPLCPKPHKELSTNMNTLNIEATSGVFMCFRWGAKGSWYDFKRLMSGSISADAYASRTIGLSAAYQNTAAQAIDIGMIYNAFMQLYSTSNSVLDYLTRTDNGGRGIQK